MKIGIDKQGAEPVAVDYAMLRAALAAVQAATPTARTSRAVPPAAVAPRDTLEAVFAVRPDGGAASRDALGHRFGLAGSNDPEN